MSQTKAIAIVGMGAILPDAFNVPAFWENIANRRYSITNVPDDRWSVSKYYDPDPSAPDKTYTKIGAYVQGYQLDALKLGLPIPPRVMAMMDFAQQWAIAASSQALIDYGYPKKPLDPERVAVIFGNSNAGERHYISTLRIHAPEYLEILQSIPNFQQLPPETQRSLLDGLLSGIRAKVPDITEDTMPGELSNIIAGRVANVFNFSGPNFVTDAACASSLAALQAAVDGLENHKFDAVLTGGIDRSMGPESYVKFCKIGALSADGSRPYADGANGFVMGEGAVVFLLKRLEDAEAAGDKIYAVIRGIGGSSDGKGKGITAPNPLGQQRAIERAWKDSGLNPATVGLIEGHGTSTKVGDVTEVSSLNAAFAPHQLRKGSVALGSVKSNIGHLKSAAGAVGLLKTTLALYHKVLPPSVNFERPNPNIDFSGMPFFVNTSLQSWEVNSGETRHAGISSFGFGGTNFHVVMEEYRPGMLEHSNQSFVSAQPVAAVSAAQTVLTNPVSPTAQAVPVAVAAGVDLAEITRFVLSAVSEKTGYPPEMLDLELDLEADLGVDTVKQAELFATIRTHYGIARREDLRLSDYNTLTKVIQFMVDAMAGDSSTGTTASAAVPAPVDNLSFPQPTGHQPSVTTPLPYQGLFFASADNKEELKQALSAEIGRIKAGQIPASLCPSADRVAKQERIAIDFVDAPELLKRAEKALNALDADAQNAWQALQGQGIYRGSGHPGKVVFMFPGQGSQYVNMLKDLYETEPVVKATFDEADAVMAPILGKPLTAFIYVDGDEEAIAQAEKNLKNTAITQPAMLTANVALLRVMEKYGFVPDMVIGHSLGEYAALVAAGVMSFAQALEVVSARGQEMTKLKMEDNGCMAAVSAPLAKVEEILQSIQGYVVIANINSPLQSVIGGETAAVDEAIARFSAEGFQAVKIPVSHAFHTRIVAPASVPLMEVINRMEIHAPERTIIANVTGDVYPSTREEIVQILGAQVASPVQFVKSMRTLYDLGARAFVEVGPKRVLNALAADNQKDKPGVALLSTNHPRKGGKASFNEALCGLFASGIGGTPVKPELQVAVSSSPKQGAESDKKSVEGIHEGRMPLTGSVVVTGAGLGLPGKDNRVFDDRNIESILSGEMRIESFSDDMRKSMLDMKVTRLIKSEAGAVMEEVTDVEQTIKLAGQRGEFDLEKDFGVPEERVGSLDISSQLAIAAGIEALRDAGIPLVMSYKSTSRGTYLPDRWKLPAAMQEETGVIFCAAFPGLDCMAQETDAYSQYQVLSAQLDEVQTLIFQFSKAGTPQVVTALEQRAVELRNQIEELNYSFDRRFIFRVLSMGHAQFAEYIGAKGPNTHVNAACATTTHAVSIAEDWIRNGRCRRVIIIAGDDVTNPNLVKWIGTSMFASGAATTEGNVRVAALPFDRRRNGMIMGMGAAALVLESEDAARERGVRGICEVVATVTANSAFHGTRLDVNHVSSIMERVVSVAESRFNDLRSDMAPRLAFISHETYTPARGGSAAAEIHALRQTFGSVANKVIVANTKGYTGHSMGVGIEDVIAVKILETGKVPPIAHIHEGFEPDPDLGDLNLSRGGKYDPHYALRLGAGFGSQIAMTLYRKIDGGSDRIDQAVYRPWLVQMSGYDHADLELTTRTLRIKDQGEPRRSPSVSRWQYGQGPTLWAGRPGNLHPRPVVVEATVAPLSQKVLNGKPVETASALNVPQTMGVEEIRAHVLQVVSEKTGYPSEMLDLELDLEADLGIDTVKQAELFATIRTHYGIPRREDLRLAEYNTLNKVIGFVTGNLDQGAATTSIQTPISPAVEQTVVEKSQDAATTGKDNGSETDAIRIHVLGVVSEKTGYPPEMLDLELDLEADLGIDTVKQAELFASIRTHYGIPRREDLRLSEYNTLNKVIGFVVDNLAQSAVEQRSEDGAQAEVSKQVVYKEEVDPAIQRRVPRPVMRPRLDLCLPTGVELNDNSRILIVKDTGKVAEALAKKLKARGVQTLIVAAAEAASQTIEWNEKGAIQGVYFLPALDADPVWKNTDLHGWKSAIDQRAETLFALAKVLPEQTFVIAATRMGGLMGFSGTSNPLGGVVTGFVKALARERKLTFAKVVDFEITSSPLNTASHLLDETLHDSSAVEISREGDLRYTPVVLDEAMPAGTQPLTQGSVFVISGGTAGIIPPVVLDLAHATKGTFFLLSRSHLLPAGDPKLKKLTVDREGLKSEIAAAITDSGKKATPVAIDQQLAILEKAKAMHEMISAVSALGGRVENIICDVQDAQSCGEAVRSIAAKAGRVDVFIHAAGVEKSRKVEGKSVEEFHQVMDVKMDGFFNLYKEMQNAECQPERVVFFTSVAGRFGNAGQVDYSAANDGLSKVAAWLNNSQPSIQAISIDWGAWAEVGMASRGSIPMLMERAGISMMKPGAAAIFVRRELEAGTRGEVVVAGNLGGMLLAAGEGHGLDTARADAALRAGTPEHAMLSHVVDFDAQGMLHLETVLDPARHAFLQDHAINGTPVLPGVIGIEGFSVAARHIASTLAGRKGGFSVERLEDIRFLAPFKFYKNQPRHIQWKARAVKEDDKLVVHATLESDTARHDGSNQHLLHFSGKVYLAEKAVTPAVSADIPVWMDTATVCADDIYRLYFHGPSFQVIDCASRSGDAVLGKLADRVKEAAKDGQLSVPMLVELCFQTAGLWEAASTGTMALPHAIGSLVIYPRPVNGEAIFAEVHPVNTDGTLRFNARVVDSQGRVFLEVQNYQTSPLPYTSDPVLLAPMRVLIGQN
jgi:malonyl CoA-acyl carrier protein transacylase